MRCVGFGEGMDILGIFICVGFGEGTDTLKIHIYVSLCISTRSFPTAWTRDFCLVTQQQFLLVVCTCLEKGLTTLILMCIILPCSFVRYYFRGLSRSWPSHTMITFTVGANKVPILFHLCDTAFLLVHSKEKWLVFIF